MGREGNSLGGVAEAMSAEFVSLLHVWDNNSDQIPIISERVQCSVGKADRWALGIQKLAKLMAWTP